MAVRERQDMRTANIMTFDEIGFDYETCNSIWNMACGDDIDGRMVDIEFWKSVFQDEDMLEGLGEEEIVEINRMLEICSLYRDEVLVEF